MEDKIEINKTHICTLKKHNNLLNVENIELVFEFEDAFKELESMNENPNRKRYELETYIENGPLSILLKRFNYCQILSRAYQGISTYTTISYTNYNNKTKTYRESLPKWKCYKVEKQVEKDKENETKIEDFHKKEKENVIAKFRERKIAYTLEKTYEKYIKDVRILAFSHNMVGYTYPEFKLNEDFDVIYKSNFGYGSVSYFYTHIKYKGIDILPYSDWIRYRYANKSNIIKFTRRHRLDNSTWLETLNFTAELYNHSVTNPETFVNQWIINECAEMVSGLEYLLSKNEKYEIIHSHFNQKWKFKLEGIELLDFKGEKISGSLTFIKKIRELLVFSEIINSYIKQIKNFNLSIYPQLKDEIVILSEAIKEIKKEINRIEPAWKKTNSEIAKFEVKKQVIADAINKKNNITAWEIGGVSIYSQIVLEQHEKKYPKYENIKDEFKKINTEYQGFKKQLNAKKEYKNKFDRYVLTINELLEL